MHRRKLILRFVLAVISLLLILSVPPVSGHQSGGYSYATSFDPSNPDWPDWMGSLPDSLRISELSIPGTHDTMALHGGVAVQCQSMSLATQLASGIRVLDIRLRHINDMFAIHHGIVYQYAVFDEDVLKPVVDFLRAHPDETVFMRVKKECLPYDRYWEFYKCQEFANTRSFEETFMWYLSEVWYHEGGAQIAPYANWVWFSDNPNPTLGEVRGKIVILDDFADGDWGLKWTDTKIQDEYKLYVPDDLDDKWFDIRDHLEETNAGSMDDIYINFLSGSGYPTPVQVLPYFVASGHSSPETDASRAWTGRCDPPFTAFPDFPRVTCGYYPYCWPLGTTCHIAYEGTNELTLNYINAGKVAKRTGIVMADFPGGGLINAIISLNPKNRPPVAAANGPYDGTEGAEIILDASASSDADGDALEYRWDFNNDGSWDTGWSPDPTAGYTWYDDWQGTAKVEVSDGNLTATATAAVTVNNVAPVITAGGSAIDENGWATVSGTITDPGARDTFTIEINWGEGSPLIYSYPAGTTTYSEQHQYLDDNPSGAPCNIYPVGVTVTDDDGGLGSAATETVLTFNPLYVDQDVTTGANNGSSWQDAVTDLQEALTCAVDGVEIWVAEGSYKPTSGTDRTISFKLKLGVAIYGGFAGTETERSQRDWAANVTTLSGDIGTTDDDSDNSYHVFNTWSVTETARLDGFTITGGNANGTSWDHKFGGGIFGYQIDPTLANLVFAGNTAENQGGGIYINSSNPSLVNVTFTGNTAGSGGGMSNNGGDPDLVNITFSGNTATGGGGGLYNWSNGSPTLTNVILWGNTAAGGNQIYNDNSTPFIRYSLVEGSGGSGSWDTSLGTDGGHNLDADPLFVDADNDDLRLQATSPAIDAGDNEALPAGITTDIDGYERFVDNPNVADTGHGTAPIVDMGACEEQSGAPGSSIYLPVVVKDH